MNLVEFVEFLIKGIVKKPDMVKVEGFELEESYMLEVIVHDDDKGLVIGRNGGTISALRTLIKIKGYQENIENIKINVDSF